MILQKDKGFCDLLRNVPKDSVYNCYYCNAATNLEEILKIDEKLKWMNPEDHEFLLGNLPSSNCPREKPFIHESDLGYDVLNICHECYKRAKSSSDYVY